MCENKDATIRVSFKNTEYEQKLLHDVLTISQNMGKSTWIKLVLAEKLYGSNQQNNQFNQFNANQITSTPNNQINTSQINNTNPLFDVDLGL